MARCDVAVAEHGLSVRSVRALPSEWLYDSLNCGHSIQALLHAAYQNLMRLYHHIDVSQRTILSEERDGESVVKAGRHLIAHSLLAANAAGLDPLAGEAPLIFSAEIGRAHV